MFDFIYWFISGLGLEQSLQEDQAIQANTLDTMDQLSVQDLAVKMSKQTMMGETKMTFGYFNNFIY